MCPSVKRKILVLENNPALADLIRFYLEESGFNVAIVSNGQKFIEKVVSLEPDLIAMEALLPDADGLEILNALIGDVRTAHIPVVVIGAEISKTVRFNLKNLIFLEKPFTEKKMRETIKSILEGLPNNKHCGDLLVSQIPNAGFQ